jgi:hypothetical protein
VVFVVIEKIYNQCNYKIIIKKIKLSKNVTNSDELLLVARSYFNFATFPWLVYIEKKIMLISGKIITPTFVPKKKRKIITPKFICIRA